jgi:hypothetical protein
MAVANDDLGYIIGIEAQGLELVGNGCRAITIGIETLRADAPTARAPLDFGKLRRDATSKKPA